eukprot:247543_1
MDPDTSYIICGGYIALNIFAIKHFYTLIGLKKQVDNFGSLNKQFGQEQGKLSHEVDRISRMNNSLKNTQSRIKAANIANRENLNAFAQLQNTIKELNVKNVSELKNIVDKANGIGDSWSKQLIEHERDMLHTVFDRYELASGKGGMTKQEFDDFALQLPDTYRKRFARLGTFDKLSGDGIHIKFSDFDAALDVFAEMDALDCDIDFSIEKTGDSGSGKGNKLLDLNINDEYIPESTLQVVPSQEDWGDISDMKRWKTQRKKYDSVSRKIVVHKKHYKTAAAKAFTSSLGFDLHDNDNDDDDDDNDNDDDFDFDEEYGHLSNDSMRSDGLGKLGRHNAQDLISAGRIESEKNVLKDK